MYKFVPHFLFEGLGLSVAGIFGLHMTKYTVKSEFIIDPQTREKVEYLSTVNSWKKQVSCAGVIVGMSATTAPMLAMVTDPEVLLPVFLSTGLIFGGATWYANSRKFGELEAWDLH